MLRRISCWDCLRAPGGRRPDCRTCKGDGFVHFKQKGASLLRFLDGEVVSFGQLVAVLEHLDQEATKQEKGPITLIDQFGRARVLSDWLGEHKSFQSSADEAWTIKDCAIYRLTAAALPEGRYGKTAPAELPKPIYTLSDPFAKTAAPAVSAPAPAPTQQDKGVESKHHPGLFMRIDGLAVTFTHASVWECYDLRTGQMVEASDQGNFPASIKAYVRETLPKLQARAQAPKQGAA